MKRDLPLSLNGADAQRTNRRTDSEMRQAIDSIQSLLFDPDADSKVWNLLCEQIQRITGADLCEVYRVKTPDETNDTTFSDSSFRLIDESTIQQWIDSDAAPRRPVFFNAPFSAGISRVLKRPEAANGIVIAPVHLRGRLQALCVLAKKQDRFSPETIHRIMPLMGAVVCALHSAESVKGDALDFGKKLSDNKYVSTLLSTSPHAILIASDQGDIIHANPQAYVMFCRDKSGDDSLDLSYKQRVLEGKSAYDLIPRLDDLFQWSSQNSKFTKDSSSSWRPTIWENIVARALCGEKFILNISASRYSYGAQRYTTLHLEDVTHKVESYHEFQRTAQQLHALTHLVPMGIVQIDKSWSCTFANDKWHEFSGLTQEETEGTGWINALHADEVKQTLECMRQALHLGEDFQSEIRLVSPHGEVRWIELHTRAIFDQAGEVDGLIATFADITERLEQQDRLRHVAEYDALTGLVNRHLFQSRLQQAFAAAERDGHSVAVMFLDLDGFKHVNDSLGHDVGDLLLQAVADRLLNTLQRKDTVARFGGDEFVVLLAQDHSDHEMETVAAALIHAIAKPYFIEGHDIFVTTSIGMAANQAAQSSPANIMKQADAALYLAKSEGKNNYQLFTDALRDSSTRRTQLTTALRAGLEKHSFMLCYQPQIDIKNGELIGFEALLRFKDDDAEVVMPDTFVPILEESGLILEVGQWIVETACRQLRVWLDEDIFPNDGALSINVSPKQLLDARTLDFIESACKSYDIPPAMLMLEITESVIINKPKHVLAAMTRLKEKGFRFALDDFGTGYSSLTYLQKYPFDHLKIDKSFVCSLCDDENDMKITEGVIALAKSLDLKVTAEGIESAQTLALLKSFGAEYCQGFFISEAESAEAAGQRLRHRKQGGTILPFKRDAL